MYVQSGDLICSVRHSYVHICTAQLILRYDTLPQEDVVISYCGHVYWEYLLCKWHIYTVIADPVQMQTTCSEDLLAEAINRVHLYATYIPLTQESQTMLDCSL